MCKSFAYLIPWPMMVKLGLSDTVVRFCVCHKFTSSLTWPMMDMCRRSDTVV